MSETVEQPEKKGYAVAERSIVEIIADLSKPVARKHLRQKSGGYHYAEDDPLPF